MHHGIIWLILYYTGGTWDGAIPSPWYNELSGSVSDLGLFAAAFALAFHSIHNYRLNKCKTKGCFRIGHHDFVDPTDGVTRKLCYKHHPDVMHKNLTLETIDKIQAKNIEARNGNAG